MSADVSLGEVVTQLGTERLIDADADRVEQAIRTMSDVQPWYVRTMVGFGAWLASLLLIGFVGSIGFTFEYGFALFGLGFMVGATVLRNASDNDFTVQCALAASLAGQALFVYGVMEVLGWEEPETIFGLIIFLNFILFFFFPDRIHRVLSVLLIAGSMASLFYIWEWNDAVPLLGPALAVGIVYLHRKQGWLIGARMGAYVRPLLSGLMLSAFGCLMISTVYVIPELIDSFEFYPRPWISTILLGAILVYVAHVSWARLLEGAPQATVVVMYVLLAVVVIAAWNAPGLLLALAVSLLGASSGHRSMTGAGLGFLVIFLSAYFYGIQITMLQKSATLIATGVAILIARWIILRLLAEEPRHV